MEKVKCGKYKLMRQNELAVGNFETN